MTGIVNQTGSRSGVIGTITANTESYGTTSLDDSWTSWNITDPPSDDDGLRMYRYGKIYVAHLQAYKGSITIAATITSTIKTLTSSDMTLPSQNVNLGNSQHSTGSEDDWITSMVFSTSGAVTLYLVNHTGSTHHIAGTFVGIDLG